jgi:hypothetical protein
LPGVIIVWAIAYALGGIVFFSGTSSRPSDEELSRFSTAARSIHDFARADRIAAVGMFIYAVAAVVAIIMVRALTDRQERAIASMPQPQYGQPAYGQPAYGQPAYGQPQYGQPQPQPQAYPQPGYPQPGYQQPQTWQQPPPPALPPPAPPPPPSAF